MNPPCTRAMLLCAVAASLLPGCALLSKGDQGAARFFSLERVRDRNAAIASEAPAAPADAAKLRLGRVTGSPHLEERLVFRDTANEVNYYRELRWTEPPEVFLKRMLETALFETRGLRHVVGGAGPTLDVQLTSFDEVRAPDHVARAQVVATLHDDQVVLWQETLTEDRPVVDVADGDDAAATVSALGLALQAAVDGIADRAVREIAARPKAQNVVSSASEKLWSKPAGAKPKP